MVRCIFITSDNEVIVCDLVRKSVLNVKWQQRMEYVHGLVAWLEYV